MALSLYPEPHAHDEFAAQPDQPLRPSDLVRVEARALMDLAARLDGPMLEPFSRAADLVLETLSRRARVLTLGVGKAGLIAQKIAATMRSTGTPAYFLHPSEALHGDLGGIAQSDLLIALSTSGETEIIDLIPALRSRGNRLISLCGSLTSTLARASVVTLDCSVTEEACTLNLAPTASTTVMLALGDALAIEVSKRHGFTTADFAALHPGGHLGRRLTRVQDLMHSGDAMPSVSASTPMPQVIHEMSHKKLGMTTVLANDKTLLGMISDGDLRRLLERDGSNALQHAAREIMNASPITIAPEAFAAEAMAVMDERRITSLIVVSPTGHALGVLHLHDLWIPASSRS